MLEPSFRLCTGQYVAMLDGDDYWNYWTDPLKLQKQVEQLETDAQCMFAFHQAQILDETTGRIYPAVPPPPSVSGEAYSLPNLLQPAHPVITLSVLFRNVF